MKKWKKGLLATICCLTATTAIGVATACSSNPGAQVPAGQQLRTPEVLCIGNRVSWDAVPGASGYAYMIDGGMVQYTTEVFLTLEKGQTVRVKALGGNGYVDSNWSSIVGNPILPLDQPELRVVGSGVAWDAIEGATKYVYKINGGADQETTETSVALQNGDTIVVKAKGEGYKDSTWSSMITFDAPYQVTIDNEGTKGVVQGAGYYGEGAVVTLTATAAPGYVFAAWRVGGQVVSNETIYSFILSGDVVVEVVWEKAIYNVAVTTLTGGSVTGNDTAEYGDEKTVVATADEGYTFAGWYKDGVRVSDDVMYTFEVTGNVALEARWTINTYSITVINTDETKGTAFGTTTADHGDEVTVTASAKEGYAFAGWYDNGTRVSIKAEYKFKASKTMTLEARWKLRNCEISVSSTTGGTANGGGTYDDGATVTVTATADTGFVFDGWYVDGQKVSSSARYTFTAIEDVELEARWKIATFTLTLNRNIVTAGNVTGAGTYEYGESGTVTATTNDGYTFLGWYEGETFLTKSESYRISSLTSDRTLTAKWEEVACVLTLATDFDIAGTLTSDGSEGGGEYGYKDMIQLMATPASNMYTFLGWYKDGVLLSSSPSFVYQITSDTTITAEWKDGWKDVEGYNYWTMPQHGRDVMPIVGFNTPNAATLEIAADVAAVHGSYPSQINDKNYQMLKDSGINTVVGWWNDWMNGNLQDDILQELDLAEKYGISYIVSHRDAMYTDSLLDFEDVSYRYMQKAAYGGTILIDEPGAVNFNDIATATRVWESSSYSDTLAYVNMLPNYAAAWQLNDCQSTGGTYTGPAYSNYEEWIQRYISIVKPQVFSFDHYPYLFTQPEFFRDGWYTNLSNVRYYTMKANIPYWVYGQLGGWPEYGQVIDQSTKHLTYGHTALQFNSMLSYGAKGIQYYNYFNPPNYTNAGNYTSAVMVDGTPTPFYEQIQRINKQVAAIDDVLLRCAWRGIIPLNNTPSTIPDGDKVSSYGALVSATAVGDAIVGCFEYRDIGYAYYVTTNNVFNASTVTLNFNSTYNLRKVQDGVSTSSTASSITLSIPAGDGVLVVVPKNK